MKKKISASIMCGDLLNIEHHLKELELCQVDYIHIDMGDMAFVSNIILGIDSVNRIGKATKIPLDIHLMVNYPSKVVEMLDVCHDDIICFQIECKEDIIEVCELIRTKGCRVGLAVKASTKISQIVEYLPFIDNIILLSVDPGFYGQPFIDSAYDKIRSVKSIIEDNNLKLFITADGAISLQRASKMAKLGADVFVCGTSSIYKGDNKMLDHVREFREVINE